MVGMRRRTARATELGATLETACAALLLTVPLALHRPHPSSAGPELGWLAAIVFTAGSGALAGMVYVSLARLRPAHEDVGLALLATLLFGAGIGYAADAAPFVRSEERR